MSIEKGGIKSTGNPRLQAFSFQGYYEVKARSRSAPHPVLRIPSFLNFSEDLFFTLTFLSKVSGENEKILYLEHVFQFIEVDD
jgi:hypothetical protein